jgi:NAD(P)-dependent dehydrogenase (short-subunit alcohol dehydrogenase family)
MSSDKGSILITGANGGLGASTVQQIVSQTGIAKDYYGIYTVRKVETADAVKRVLQKAAAAQHRYELLPLDLSSLASVREAAEDINKRVASGEVPPIRALILNAGWQEQYTQTWTGDGFDASFQNNYLGHFLLTHLLLQSMDKENGRIVVVGSWTHEYVLLYFVTCLIPLTKPTVLQTLGIR